MTLTSSVELTNKRRQRCADAQECRFTKSFFRDFECIETLTLSELKRIARGVKIGMYATVHAGQQRYGLLRLAVRHSALPARAARARELDGVLNGPRLAVLPRIRGRPPSNSWGI